MFVPVVCVISIILLSIITIARIISTIIINIKIISRCGLVTWCEHVVMLTSLPAGSHEATPPFAIASWPRRPIRSRAGIAIRDYVT